MTPKNDEAAFAVEGPGHDGVFGTEEAFIEAAGAFEGLSRAKLECAAGNACEPHEQAEPKEHEVGVKGRKAIESRQCAAANGAFVHHAQCGRDGGGVDDGVGVHEEEAFALCRAGAGIARGGDLAVIHGDDAGVVLPGDFRGGVGGGVVGDDDFVRVVDGAGARVDCLQGRGEAGFFVMGGDDERDHGRSGIIMKLTEAMVGCHAFMGVGGNDCGTPSGCGIFVNEFPGVFASLDPRLFMWHGFAMREECSIDARLFDQQGQVKVFTL